MFSPSRRAFALVGLIVLVLAPFGAHAAGLPPAVQYRIDAAAAEARELARQEGVLSRTLNVGDLAAADSSLTHRRTEAVLSGVVISAIAENPALAPDVIAAAVAAAPEFRDSIVSNAEAAFPGFAGAIRVGVVARAPAAPIYRPAPSAQGLARPVAQPIRQAQLDLPPAPAPEAEIASANEIHDPWEGFNRGVFAFNDVIDRFLFKPLAQVYGFLMPDAFQDNIQNAFRNLNEPVVLANDLLQFEGGDALNTTGRFLVNTTVGVVGLFEIAEGWGMPRHPADFGQTLYSYGSGPGPYLVLPLLGPSTVRDGTGTLVDTFLHPRTYLLDFTTNLGLTGGSALVRREALIETLDDLRANSIDYYAALRSAYYQDRKVDLNRGKAPDTSDLDKMFDQME